MACERHGHRERLVSADSHVSRCRQQQPVALPRTGWRHADRGRTDRADRRVRRCRVLTDRRLRLAPLPAQRPGRAQPASDRDRPRASRAGGVADRHPRARGGDRASRDHRRPHHRPLPAGCAEPGSRVRARRQARRRDRAARRRHRVVTRGPRRRAGGVAGLQRAPRTVNHLLLRSGGRPSRDICRAGIPHQPQSVRNTRDVCHLERRHARPVLPDSAPGPRPRRIASDDDLRLWRLLDQRAAGLST